MTESSFVWGGTTVGDAVLAPYDDDEWSDLWKTFLTYDKASQGVIPTLDPDYNGQLAVTAPGAMVARVAKGLAVVDGKIYKNTANVDLTAVGGAGTYNAIYLYKDFGGALPQTVKLAIATNGAGGFLTRALALAYVTGLQVDGTSWAVPLGTAYISGGAVTAITDERSIISGAGMVKLAETRVIAAAATVDWTSIPQCFRHLKIVASVRSSGAVAADSFLITFNADAGANYSYGVSYYDYNTNTHTGSINTAKNNLAIGVCATANDAASYFSPAVIEIPDYASALIYHPVHCISSTLGVGMTLSNDSGLWLALAGINRITITPVTAPNTFAVGTVFTLYGLP